MYVNTTMFIMTAWHLQVSVLLQRRSILPNTACIRANISSLDKTYVTTIATDSRPQYEWSLQV